MKSRTTPARLVLLACVGLALALPGCNGHGTHTTMQQNAAKNRLNGIKAATEYQTAHGAFLAQDFEKAMRHVDRSIALNNSVVRSHVLRGRTLMEMGELEQAIESFFTAEAVDPRAVEPQYYLGLVYERYAQHDKALARYLQAAELDPADPQYTLAAAEVMIDMGQLPEAQSFLVQRSDQFQHNAGIRQTLGHIAMMQGNYPAAVKEFSDARLLAPEDQGVAEDLARAHVENGDYADADAILGRILALDANAARRDLKMMRATCLIKTDRLAEAREILVRLTRDKESANDVEAFIALGNVSFLMKDMVRLRQASARVVAIAPKRPEGYLLRALHQRHTGDLASAEQNAQKATSLDGGSEAWSLLAMIQQEAGKSQASAASLANARRLDAQRESELRALQQRREATITSVPQSAE